MSVGDRSSRFRFLLIILFLGCFSCPASGQSTVEDSRVGKKFIVTTAGAELKTPEKTVWRAYPGEVYTVGLVNGEWLWIQSKGGWLWEKDGVFFDTAIGETSDRLARNPTAEAYHVRGLVLVAHQQYERALQDFSNSLRRSPRDAGIYNNRGQCHYLLKDYPAAIADFTEAIKHDPKHFVAFNNRALAHMAQESYADARRDIRSALRLNPKYPEALLNRGVIHQKTGSSEEAIADFTAAIELDENYSSAYANRAFSCRALGRYREAIADLRKAIQLAPENFEPVNDLAFTLATAKDDRIRDGAKAIALAERASAMTDEEHWNTLDTLAVARAAVNDFDGASEILSRAIELAPEQQQAKLKAHQELIAAGMPVLE